MKRYLLVILLALTVRAAFAAESEVASHPRNKQQPYVTAGDRAYLIGNCGADAKVTGLVLVAKCELSQCGVKRRMTLNTKIGIVARSTTGLSAASPTNTS